MTQYSRHLLKYCSKHGLEKEYNDIRSTHEEACLELQKELSPIYEQCKKECISVGKKYTDLLHSEMGPKAEDLKRIDEEILLLKKRRQEINDEIDARHRYYQDLTDSEERTIERNWEILRDARYKLLSDAFDTRLHERFGNV